MTERDCTLRRQVSRILVSSMALASPAMAQETPRAGLEEVVVTAQRREESLQDAPIAITALSSEHWSCVASPISARSLQQRQA